MMEIIIIIIISFWVIEIALNDEKRSYKIEGDIRESIDIMIIQTVTISIDQARLHKNQVRIHR